MDNKMIGDAKPKPPPTVNSYRMKPPLSQTFKASEIKQVIQRVMSEKLTGKAYAPEEVSRLTREISDAVSTEITENVPMPRYKHVVQVIIGQQLGAGCRYIAKCCWDAECDSQTSDVFSNANLFCVCTVFGIYLY